MFFAGQKVVCVNAKEIDNGPTGLVEGDVYTVLHDLPGVVGVQILEADPSPCMGFRSDRFRPALTKKTDISIFKQAPAPTKIREDA